MITKITGRLVRLHDEAAILAVQNFEHEVLIPSFVRRQLQSSLGQEISLHTIQYVEGSPMQGRMTPRLIGFSNEIEREFFEMFCSVDGVGVKKALRAMVRAVPDVATAIEEQDVKCLASLPGIGPATAERIVAKLRRKMPKFALLVAQVQGDVDESQRDVVNETYDVLRSLGHADGDARKLLERATSGKRKYKDVQELLQVIYQQSHQ